MKVSNQTRNTILSTVKAGLMPDVKKIILKVFAIHIVSALLTLTVCPQLGYGLVESRINLMDLFMIVGPRFCDFACGTFFTSVSVIFIHFILTRDEFRFLRFHRTLMLSTMFLTSFGFLFMLNPNLFVEFTFLWVVGALVGVLVPMELVFRIQHKAF